MKTAVSLPEATFREADRVAKKLGKSRSRFYADALKSYLSRFDAEDVTKALDAVYGPNAKGDLAVQGAAVRLLAKVEW